MPFSKPIAILIVDDNEMNRYTLSRYLSRLGWAVWEAGTGQQGLEMARKGPHVAIIDINLPDMLGYEVCRRIKADPETRSVAVLHTSASFTKSDDIAFGLDQGADAYLTEPIDPTELIATLKALMRLRSAEARAEINLAKLEAVINSMVEGVITGDRVGQFVTMNAAALQLHGFASNEDIPKSLADQEALFDYSLPDGTPLPSDRWPLVRAARGETVTNLEIRVVRRDNGKAWIGSYNATPVKTPIAGGQVIATVFDVTDRKAAEIALFEARVKLQHHADELERKVEERTASLREAISHMEEFSYTVSHDLRAPLRSIKGYAEVLLQDYSHRLKGDGAHYLERIIENGHRMERLVSDVLTISRVSNSKVKLEALDLTGILQSLVREYPNLHPSVAAIEIGPIPAVIGHESLCIQVFSNLLSNGVKFVRPGVTPRLRVSAAPHGDQVRITVEDNGIGIAPEFHQKIFGMFERLDPENRYGGTGIGLAIVRRAVEKMNGRVGLESDGRSGTRFWVELPAAHTHASP